MQVLASQVIVQLSYPATPVTGRLASPVFSVSHAPAMVGESGVRISAAARALAEVSPMAARPQLNLVVQSVGAFGAAQTFVPFNPAALAAERVAVVSASKAVAGDPRQDARAPEQPAAQSAATQSAEATESAVEATPVQVFSQSLPGPSSLNPALAAYQQAAAATPEPVVVAEA